MELFFSFDFHTSFEGTHVCLSKQQITADFGNEMLQIFLKIYKHIWNLLTTHVCCILLMRRKISVKRRLSTESVKHKSLRLLRSSVCNLKGDVKLLRCSSVWQILSNVLFVLLHEIKFFFLFLSFVIVVMCFILFFCDKKIHLVVVS